MGKVRRKTCVSIQGSLARRSPCRASQGFACPPGLGSFPADNLIRAAKREAFVPLNPKPQPKPGEGFGAALLARAGVMPSSMMESVSRRFVYRPGARVLNGPPLPCRALPATFAAIPRICPTPERHGAIAPPARPVAKAKVAMNMLCTAYPVPSVAGEKERDKKGQPPRFRFAHLDSVGVRGRHGRSPWTGYDQRLAFRADIRGGQSRVKRLIHLRPEQLTPCRQPSHVTPGRAAFPIAGCLHRKTARPARAGPIATVCASRPARQHAPSRFAGRR